MGIKKRKIVFYGLLAFLLLSFGYVKYHQMNINDIGLGVLGWVKKANGNAVDLQQLAQSTQPTIKHDDWTALLEKHVSAKGQVNYLGFIQDSLLLNKYLNDLSKHAPGKNWTEEEQLAYWINAYNAFTVKLILDHYPLKSIKDISDGLPMINSPWDIKFFTIGEIPFDLNTIEHDVLRKQFEEPRIHFAINCASISCPVLRNEAYTAQQLDQQLEEQAVIFIRDQDRNIINEKETKLSRIFDWFRSDFIKKTDLLTYLEQYQPMINEVNKVEYLEYNWALNE